MDRLIASSAEPHITHQQSVLRLVIQRQRQCHSPFPRQGIGLEEVSFELFQLGDLALKPLLQRPPGLDHRHRPHTSAALEVIRDVGTHRIQKLFHGVGIIDIRAAFVVIVLQKVHKFFFVLVILSTGNRQMGKFVAAGEAFVVHAAEPDGLADHGDAGPALKMFKCRFKLLPAFQKPGNTGAEGSQFQYGGDAIAAEQTLKLAESHVLLVVPAELGAC